MNEPTLLSATGTIIEAVLTWTIFGILFVNISFGDSSPLLWGMMNSMQLIYYFPLLSFYYPSNFLMFLKYFKVSDLSFSIPIRDEYISRVSNFFVDWD